MSGDEGVPSGGGDLLSLGLLLAAAVVLPLLGGILLDARAHSSPAGFFAGLIVGIAAATAVLVNRVRRSS